MGNAPLAAARGMTLLLLGAAAALFWAEKKSPAAALLRAKAPFAARVALGEHRHLAVYQPRRRTLDLIYLPPGASEKPLRAALDETVGGLVWTEHSLSLSHESATPEPALALKDRLTASLAGLSFWRGLARELHAPSFGFSRFDLLLWALELCRLKPEAVRCAWLPEEAQQAAFLKLRFLPTPAPEGRILTAEVLNATGQKGVASQATKVLRSKDVDVVTFGNAAAQDRTVAYDRTGRLENAHQVLEHLGCPKAAALTQMNLKKILDVTILLAADCPIETQNRASSRNP